MSWPSPPARSIHLPASAICAAHRPQHWAGRAGGRRSASPRRWNSPAIPCPHLPVRRGGTRAPLCKESGNAHFSQSRVLWAASTAGGFSGPGARGLGGVERGQVGKQAAPLPSGSPHLPPATRPAAASSVPRTLRGAVSAQLRARREGAERWRAFPTQSLSCRFHSSSSSQRLHPARSTVSFSFSIQRG